MNVLGEFLRNTALFTINTMFSCIPRRKRKVRTLADTEKWTFLRKVRVVCHKPKWIKAWRREHRDQSLCSDDTFGPFEDPNYDQDLDSEASELEEDDDFIWFKEEDIDTMDSLLDKVGGWLDR